MVSFSFFHWLNSFFIFRFELDVLKSALLPHIDTQSPDLSAYSHIKHITCWMPLCTSFAIFIKRKAQCGWIGWMQICSKSQLICTKLVTVTVGLEFLHLDFEACIKSISKVEFLNIINKSKRYEHWKKVWK